ncbi:MAG: pyridoxamine 5'-phosphate oxidase family protein [Acidobacteriaceae bacterium]|nr:pyridoxamine 5'-phosphate oxidase family protein [Acidobacteriaceae bacterium]MBV9779912.1 pyridoxamine 5'-phosphate oxidase family protein [Acidobacteriaceae bacterium]
MSLTERTKLRRLPKRGSHEPETIHAILDAGFLAHVGFQVNGQPFVIPTLYGREQDMLYLHGSAASRMLGELETGMPACVTVTLVDGLVLARSAFHHSMNYRSVVAFGIARKINEPEHKTRALRIISEHVIAGRWNDVRGPTEKELKATSVIEFSIDEASAKVRQGPPLDDEEDYSLPVWAGVVPIRLQMTTPIPDSRLPEGIDVPKYVRAEDSSAL